MIILMLCLYCLFHIVYTKYPEDTQQIQIRVESYGFNSNGIMVTFTNSAVKLNQLKVVNPVTFIANGGVPNFNTNPVWTYVNFQTKVQQPNYGTSGATASFFSQPVVYLNVARKSTGIVYPTLIALYFLVAFIGMREIAGINSALQKGMSG